MDFNADHFALFNLPRVFRIDATQLDTRFRELQAQVHPDRFADADETQRRLSLQWATKANEAYLTLKKPLSRAMYLLELADAALNPANNRAMSTDFLVEQMEWREAVADARSARDLAELELLEERVGSSIREGYGELASLLDDQHDLFEAGDRVRRLMFLERLRVDIDEALAAVEA